MPANSSQSVDPDVLVPNIRLCRNKITQQFFALFRIEIDNFDAVLSQPIDPALKRLRFANDYRSNAELANETAAIPARSKGRHHNCVTIAALAPGFAKGIRLTVYCRIVLLHATVMTATEKFATAVKQRRADRNSAFRQSSPGFFYGDVEQRLCIKSQIHNGHVKAKRVFVLISFLMSQTFQPGDFLVFQLEAGFGLLRVLAIDEYVWHVAAYGDFFADVESAEATANEPSKLTVSSSHFAITQRAFDSTQVARIAHRELRTDELEALKVWREDPSREVSNRSIRLLLGLR